MLLHSLTLNNFRSYQKTQFSFAKKMVIIVGQNTSGKTNILEAIFALATGKSFRADIENEMIAFDKEIANISGLIETKEGQSRLKIVLTKGELYGRKIATKRYFLNNIPKRMTDFVGSLRVSLFWPQDIDLVIDSPGVRRRYLDFVLSQIDQEYLRALRIFEKALRSRNKLLEQIREGQASREELPYWNQVLIKTGNILTSGRKNFLDFLNLYSGSLNGNQFFVLYHQSIISEERLNHYSREEIASATTLVGPHRDDFKIRIKNQALPAGPPAGRSDRQVSSIKYKEKDLHIFGSRGEQRLGVLWLKLGELAFLKEKSLGDSPVLLLDDIFSEFDHQNRQLIFEHLGNQQTIITTTDIHLIEDKLKKQAQIIELS